jgi:hypothetical protein
MPKNFTRMPTFLPIVFTKSKYFGQLYTFHSYFPPQGKYDKDLDRVWVKRMIPCAWAFTKRRRTKDYICILKVLKNYAKIVDENRIMILDPDKEGTE